MESYLERYRAGEYEMVWQDLMSFGASIREEPLYTDAQTVAVEMMLRTRYNITLLWERLQRLDFQFAFGAQRVWQIPTKYELTVLEKIVDKRGSISIVALAWATMIGRVDFCGAHPRLSRYWHWEEPPDHGPSSDPLSFGLFQRTLSDVRRLNTKDTIYRLNVSPDVNHKSNMSGGDPYFMLLPTTAFDAPLVTTVWSNGLHLIPYLRTCFGWGGFPGLQTKPEAAAAAREELTFLTKDLLPI